MREHVPEVQAITTQPPTAPLAPPWAGPWKTQSTGTSQTQLLSGQQWSLHLLACSPPPGKLILDSYHPIAPLPVGHRPAAQTSEGVHRQHLFSGPLCFTAGNFHTTSKCDIYAPYPVRSWCNNESRMSHAYSHRASSAPLNGVPQ